jgi:hypothetical protein
MNELKLGDKAHSKISGFSGIVTGTAVYLHGTCRVELTSSTLVDGKQVSEWFYAGELIKD